MGRFFEALLQADSCRQNGEHHDCPVEAAPHMEPPAILAPELPASPAACPSHSEEDGIPFVEVGGPALEGSPSVLAVKAEPSKADRQGLAKQITAPEIAFRAFPTAPPPWAPAAERFAPELVAFHHPDHPVSRQYRDLLARLDEAKATERAQVLLFSAAEAGAGTTTVVLNLALTCAAQGGRRVAVVDANLARPVLASRLGLHPVPGLTEVIAGTAKLAEALQETGLEFLQILAAGKTLKSDTARLGGEPMAHLLMKLRERFDLIMVDGMPWGDRMTDLGKACDGVYLIVKREANAAQDLVEELIHGGIRLRGCVMTRA